MAAVKWVLLHLYLVLRASSPARFSGPCLDLRGPGIFNAISLLIEKYVALSRLLPLISLVQQNLPVLCLHADNRKWPQSLCFPRYLLKTHCRRPLPMWWELKSTRCLLPSPQELSTSESRPLRGPPWCILKSKLKRQHNTVAGHATENQGFLAPSFSSYVLLGSHFTSLVPYMSWRSPEEQWQFIASIKLHTLLRAAGRGRTLNSWWTDAFLP